MMFDRDRRVNRASDRTVVDTENANGKRTRSGPGEGHTKQHDYTRREQLYDFKRQVGSYLNKTINNIIHV